MSTPWSAEIDALLASDGQQALALRDRLATIDADRLIQALGAEWRPRPSRTSAAETRRGS
jgi:hypothetical protein